MPNTVESVREVRARVSVDEIERGIAVVPDPNGECVAIFDSDCECCVKYDRFRVVPFPKHKQKMLLDGDVLVWDLISDMPDVRLKCGEAGAPHAWN